MRILQNRFFVFSVLCSIILGCQTPDKAVAEGDRFEVTEEFWGNGTFLNTDGNEESFKCILPIGTVLKATEKSDAINQFFSTEPISIGTESDRSVIENRLVPQNIRSKPDYAGYFFSFKKDLLVYKLKRLEK